MPSHSKSMKRHMIGKVDRAGRLNDQRPVDPFDLRWYSELKGYIPLVHKLMGRSGAIVFLSAASDKPWKDQVLLIEAKLKEMRECDHNWKDTDDSAHLDCITCGRRMSLEEARTLEYCNQHDDYQAVKDEHIERGP